MRAPVRIAIGRPARTPVRLRLEAVHVAALAMVVALAVAGAVAVHVAQLRAAGAQIARLRAHEGEEQRTIDAMARQAQALQRQNAESQRAIEAIRRELGVGRQHAAAGRRRPRLPVAATERTPAVGALAARLARLRRETARTSAQAQRLKRLVARIMVARRLAAIARQRMLAAIPSLNPVNGGINAAFGYRTDPWPEFHRGLDLAADYGAPVHVAADVTVVSAGWDGGFGMKIDVDHGNGYHTWYCHLSHLDVVPGQRVARGQIIAAVGSTGESTGPHLHYQVMRDGIAVDPQPFLHGVPPAAVASLRDQTRVP